MRHVISPRNSVISVAMATFNGDSYVAEQLSSILAQSRVPAQVVVADDHSTDGTLKTVRNVIDYAQSVMGNRSAGKRFDVLTTPANLGVAANFFRAVQSCTGDLIAFSDQDDVWHENKLEKLSQELAKRSPALLVFSDARLIDDQGQELTGSLFRALRLSRRELREIQTPRAWDVLMRRNVVTGATMLCHRDLVRLAGPIPAGWIHDEWFAVVAAWFASLNDCGLALVSEQLIDYRQHSQNVIGATAMTMATRVDRLTSPRADRNARLLRRAESLAEWTAHRATENPDAAHKAQQKLAHEQARSRLPASRIARVAPVIKELFSGRYSQYGRGLQDVVRDLVQPS